MINTRKAIEIIKMNIGIGIKEADQLIKRIRVEEEKDLDLRIDKRIKNEQKISDKNE